ncbi:hypothetical protein NPIL_360691 [Nephila pilipes]|uniref:Uncharacterized protein n=1 Tax=Nephila pilipes TaxID=299642 RepID=A0A8X6IDL7_NEPPI|nr:hypothetical protein NPIL_301341 [Nephila pilipes]GFS67653.1 hypothetical protein NPIL_40911 [Nephila pilipes]GFT54990.1 hypothetical protein NPIL_601771 [Nephila pilipes]GFU22191.1 hypothetical protein NPIL_360691 [Nephila pilipes]
MAYCQLHSITTRKTGKYTMESIIPAPFRELLYPSENDNGTYEVCGRHPDTKDTRMGCSGQDPCSRQWTAPAVSRKRELICHSSPVGLGYFSFSHP